MSILEKSITARVATAVLGLAMVMSFTFAPVSAQAQSVGDLQAQITALLAQITALQAQLSGGSSSAGAGVCPYTWTRDLTTGATGNDVMTLQKFLNSDSATQLGTSGAGSPGNETSYFGGITAAGVVKFQNKYASEVLTPLGLSAGTGYFGSSSRAKANALCVSAPTTPTTPTTPTAPAGTSLNISAATQPANSLAPQGAARVPFTRFTVTAGLDGSVTLDSVTVERNGLLNKAVFAGVVLLDQDGAQLGNAKTLNSNYQATIGDSVTVPAGQSRTFTVAGNMGASLSAYAGEVGGLSVIAVNTSAAVSGALPINGASHTVNATLSLGSATLNVSSFDPNTSQSKEIGTTGVRFAGVRLTAGSGEDIRLRNMRWNQTGSASKTDLANVVVVVDGVEYPTTVSSDGKYYSVNIGSGVVVPKGNNLDIYVKGDIIDGTNRTVVFDIDKATDIYISGELFLFGITPTAGSVSAAATSSSQFTSGTPFFDASHLTITAGSASTIQKSAQTPAQNIAVNVPDQPLGAFEANFKGEAVTVSGMTLTVATSAGSTEGAGGLTNVSIVDENGSVVAGPIDSSGTGTSLVFSDSITFQTGSHTYFVRGKVPSGTLNGLTYTLTVTPSGWTSPVGDSTGDTISLATFGAFTLNTMTVKAAALAVTLSSTPAAQTVVAGTQGFTFANYQLDASQSGEDVRFSSMVLTNDAGNNAKAATAANLSACQLFNGSTALNSGSNIVNPSQAAATSTEATGTTHTFQFNDPLTVPKGTSMTVALRCNISSSSDASSVFQWGIANVAANMLVTGVTSSNAVTETVTASNGQVMTVGTGSFAATTDSSSPSYNIAAAGTTGVVLGRYKLAATNEDITVQRIGLGLGSITASSSPADLIQVSLWVDGSQVGTAQFNGTSRFATSTLSQQFTVEKDDTKIVEVRGDLRAHGPSESSNPGALLTVDIDTNSTNTQGVGTSGSTINATGSTAVAGVRVFNSFPTVAQQTSGMSSTLIAQSGVDLYRFSVKANTTGDIALNELTVNVATSSVSTTNGTTTVTNLKVFAYTDSSFANAVSGSSFTDGQVNTTTATLLSNGNNVEAFVAPLTIPAGQIYYFRVVGDVTQVAGTTGSAGTVTTKIIGDSAYPSLASTLLSAYVTTLGNFIWSPLSTTTSAAAANEDWTNGYRVSGLPSAGTNSFTLTK
jgi:hypothetical protein